MILEKFVTDSEITTSHAILPQYANHLGLAHGGIIMKYIDETAGYVAMRHCNKAVVTASIDRINFYKPVPINSLLILKSSVNYTGYTSMEVGTRVEAENPITSEKKHIATAYLTFVAIDENLKPSKIPKIILKTDNETRRNLEAVARRKSRIQLVKDIKKKNKLNKKKI